MILFGITTLNHNNYTEPLLKSIQETDIYKEGLVDILIVDDFSQKDDVEGLAFKYKVRFLGKDKPKGLTNSWNTIYQYYKNNLYTNLYIANNDILIPKGCIENIQERLVHYHSVSPLCNPEGIGNWKEILHYNVCKRFDNIPMELADNDEYYNTVQGMVHSEVHGTTAGYEDTDFFHGFLMCFTRDILRNELPDGNLFNPNNINIGNEIELNMRFKGKKGVALNAFIYHHKGITLNQKNRNILENFHK